MISGMANLNVLGLREEIAQAAQTRLVKFAEEGGTLVQAELNVLTALLGALDRSILILPEDRDLLVSQECQVPPPGWRCTRGSGHGGPCAAIEIRAFGPNVSRRGRAMKLVEKILNDRKGFHVDQLDPETRLDLLGAIVDAAQSY